MSSTQVDQTTNDDREHCQRLRDLTKTFAGIEKPFKNGKTVENLTDLISELHKVFESDHVNIEYVNHLLLSYKSNPIDWKKFAKFDRYRYTRNLVDAGNGKFNLIILCWGEGHGSAIHDHSDSHCFMKMLKGELAEVRYTWPENKTEKIIDSTATIGNTDDCEEADEYDGESIKELSRCKLDKDGVCYINDNLGLHRVENPSHTDVAVSLHLYCPPFDACKVFNKKTGKSTKALVTFWSKFGESRNKEFPATAPEDN